MKTPKTCYPLVAASVIIAGGMIPMSFGDEQLLVPTSQNAPAKTQAEADSVTKLIQAEVVQPLTLLASMRNSFSRRGPSHSTSYHLAETTTKGAEGQRTFTVTQKVMPLLSKSKTKEAKSSGYLKLRHLANSQEIQVDLKGKWVALNEHPVLKSLPRLKPQNKITP